MAPHTHIYIYMHIYKCLADIFHMMLVWQLVLDARLDASLDAVNLYSSSFLHPINNLCRTSTKV